MNNRVSQTPYGLYRRLHTEARIKLIVTSFKKYFRIRVLLGLLGYMLARGI